MRNYDFEKSTNQPKLLFYNSDPSTLFVVRYENDFNND